MDLDVYADDTITQLLQDVKEIGYQYDHVIHGSREVCDAIFEQLNA